MKTLFRVFLILVGIILGWYGHALYVKSDSVKTVTNFKECADAGYPVMESYPRQCKTPDGKNFVEEVTAETVSGMIVVESPLPGERATSTLRVIGEARGNWYFEASFPVTLKDGDGKILAQAPAQAKGEWMTTEFVPFELMLSFPKVTRETSATLILSRDNPSGLPEFDADIEIPVVLIP